jgi:hypothetical protein
LCRSGHSRRNKRKRIRERCEVEYEEKNRLKEEERKKIEGKRKIIGKIRKKD